VLCEHVFRPVAHLVVLVLAPLRVPPPAVVLAAAAAGIAAAVELALGHLIVAALLVQLKTVLDNADGQLARVTGRVTVFGRYLDSECDLLVNAALFAGLGYETGRPWLAFAGFVSLTAVLSANFNVERLYRGPQEPDPPVAGLTAVLARAYATMYGWHDAAIERVVATPPRRSTVGALAQLGMSSQLAAFGLCLALGRPAAAAWLALAQLPFAMILVLRRPLAPAPAEQEGTA
jgi:archaetidylinositol phosphate synthase